MTSLLHALTIGRVILENNLALAPMAGTTDVVFRRFCRKMGAGLTVTELVSARGIVHDPSLSRNWRYLAIDPADNPVGIQLFGADPADFRQAIEQITRHPVLRQCSLIDLNMGCPVAKVIRTGAGCALMETPDLAVRIIEASVRAAEPSGMPVTVKIRKGMDDRRADAAGFARLCADAGAAAVTVHGRTRQQMYGGAADWSAIAAVKDAVLIPVFGNGDVRSADDAMRMLRQTGADGVMIGRAAQGNPWIFRQISAALAGRDDAEEPACRDDRDDCASLPTPAERLAVFHKHLLGLCDLIGEKTAVREMRKQLAWYLKGFPGVAVLKMRGTAAATLPEMLEVLEEWRIYLGNSCENL